MEHKCPGCNEPLLNNLEEQLTVTVLRTSRIIGIEYESPEGEICFDYDALPNEDDLDCDTPVDYRCASCGYYLTKETVLEVLKNGSKV